MAIDDESDEWSNDGPTLGADGRLEGRLSAVEPAPPSSQGPAGPTDEALELGERPLPQPANISPEYRDLSHLRRRERRARVMKALAVVGLLGLLGVAGFALLSRNALRDLTHGGTEGVRDSTPLDRLLNRGTRIVVFDSVPPGATVTAGDTVIGVTPWSGDSSIPSGTELQFTLAGYRPVTEVMPAAAQPRLTVRLTKQ